ncbi:unnamed protein product [Adineta ricciae]|uniref:Uncharacterized protein n=1 Tax=Adineta ricciae TaxID=249248 RepID=A0A814WJB9_ADIRI|nr:unnamed protein product [Adineta ricciae]
MMDNTVAELNQDVGYSILAFLDGIDAVNFVEAVDNSQQFWSIAKTLDHHFIKLMEALCGRERVLLLPSAIPPYFTDEYEVVDGRLIQVPSHYSAVEQPPERLYIHPCFTIEGFAKLCEVYQTPLFKCYSRLLPLNIVWYNADFGLLNYEWYSHTIGSKRILNDHENKLFRVSTYFNRNRKESCCSNMKFVHTMDEFKQNLVARFSSDAWLRAIDFSKWAIVGGSVLNALCNIPFFDSKEQDVNLVYYVHDILDFKKSIDDIVNNINKIGSKSSTNKIRVEKITGTPNYNVFLPCHVQLNFIWTPIRKSKKPLSHILHNFDMDICQVAFTGDRIVSTFPFLQALATRSFIVYTLNAQSPKHLLPTSFDGDFDSLMAQEEIPLYRVEYQHYIDDDGEIQIITKEFRRPFLDNVDTFGLQEKFISTVCPQLLHYN